MKFVFWMQHSRWARKPERCLRERPTGDDVGDRNLVNIAPLQLSKEILRVHSARLDEALVTAALYLDARDLKSACNDMPTGNRVAPSLVRGLGLWSSIAVIVGSMIGQAVFLVASDLARELGSPGRVLAWVDLPVQRLGRVSNLARRFS